MDIDGNNYCPRCMRKLAETDTDVSACPLCGREPRPVRSPMALDTGTLLAGRYQLGDVIGQGGFGITYAAWDETLGMPVAVKEYFPREYASRETEISDELRPYPDREAVFMDGLSRFRRESNLLVSLQGIPCVVNVLDFFSENGTAYIVMEFVHGKPIDRWVRENNVKPAKLLEKLRPVFDALVRTHSQGVIHRDITPDNLLVEEDGSLKLIDFGSAVEYSRSEGTVLLTRRYAPMEQYARNYGKQGPWTDVYSLAAVLYTLFSGKEPMEAPLRAQHDELKPISKLHTGLKRREAAAIDKALIVAPEKRTQSMAEFRAALYNLPMPQEVIRRKRSARRMIAFAAILLVLSGLVTLNFTSGLPVGSGLLGSLRDDGIHIVRRLRKREEISIPESVLGIPVTQIAHDAFRGKNKLRSVSIPGSVRTIGDSAFYGCKNLEEVTLAEGVEVIGNTAFGACDNLQTLSLPDSLKEIGESSVPEQAELLTVWGSRGTEAERYSDEHGLRFSDASELTWEIRDGAAEITSVTSEAKRLTLPNMVEGVPVTAIREGVRLLTQEEVWLPEYLKVVTPELFWTGVELDTSNSAAVNRVRLGSHIREIGAGAFSCCNNLRSLELPDTLEVIGDKAFSWSAIEELELPDGLREIGNEAFYAINTSRMVIPDSVESIGQYAFSFTSNLTEIKLPESLRIVPRSAFSWSGIHTIQLPESVTLIDIDAFEDSNLQWIALPDGVQTISYTAFSSCKDLRFILIPASVTEIPYYTFDGCPTDLVIAGYAGTEAEAYAKRKGIAFEDVSLWTEPDGYYNGRDAYYSPGREECEIRVPWYNEKENCLITGCECYDNPFVEKLILSPFQEEIGTSSFQNDTALRRVDTRGKILDVGSSAFDGCAALETVPLENAVRIEFEAFRGCSNLASLPLENVEYIGFNAFEGCTSLGELRLADRVSCVENEAFSSCSGLKYIILPSHPRDLSRNIFKDCTGLQLVVFEEGTAGDTWCNFFAFQNCASLRTLYYPSSVSIFYTHQWIEGFPCLTDIWFFNPEMEIGVLLSGTEVRWIIHGYAGSTAEAWAKKYSVQFEPIPDGMAMPDPWEIVESYDFIETE